MSLLPIAEAQARLLGLASPLPIETVPLLATADRFAAEEVIARRDQPAADLSAMDGYAIRFDERPGPWRLVGESAAGRGLDRPLAPGEAARIFTGAPLPAGADTILIQEEAEAADGHVRMSGEGPPHRHAHVRPRGSDFSRGDVLIRAGERITAARLALAAIGGHGALPVRRKCRVALLSTGDELVAPGGPTSGVLLPASNAPMLAALIGGTLAVVEDAGLVPDRLDALTSAFARAAETADVLVTTGGVSVGDHDLVRPALQAAGATLDFWRVAMRPGKPLMAGRLGDAIVLGLPGNPVSAYVTATLFLMPLLAHLAGSTQPLPRTERARLAGPLPATGLRADLLRARHEAGDVVALVRQDSGDLTTLAAADCLIVRPPHAPAAIAGESAEILRFA